jgi:ferredoxin-type protein NapH
MNSGPHNVGKGLGLKLLVLSLFTRGAVLLLLCFLALMTEYLNFKVAHNNPRLVELSAGKPTRIFYEFVDKTMGWFGDPLEIAQTNAGMTWSIRLGGIPFTDPISALSVLVKRHQLETGFALGLIVPLGLAAIFGRVFCAYICPASLLFFSISRLRRLLIRWFYFPDWQMDRGFAWGVLLGGLGIALWTGHGIWSLLLPYFALGQTIFHGLALGTLSISVWSLVVFSALDLFFGKQLTCRYVCPTGRLLGAIGRKSVLVVQRDASRCHDNCHACTEICPLKVDPKRDQQHDCSLCGECLAVCPTQCLTVDLRHSFRKSITDRNLEGSLNSGQNSSGQ